MHWKPFIVLLLLLLSVGLVMSPASLALGQGQNHMQSPSGVTLPLAINSSSGSNITIEWNGTVVISGEVAISGGQMSSVYAGHGAMYVSGNFIVKTGGTLRINNLSIVFVNNASFVNNGRIYSNDSMITVYTLSTHGLPDVTFFNYGLMVGSNTSLEFPGLLIASSSTLILSGGYYGRGAFSFSSDVVSSVLVFDEEKVYGSQMVSSPDSLGYSDLVSMNITRSTLYAYNTFFNLAPPKPLKQVGTGNKSNNSSLSYSSTTGKYSGGFINMASSSAYYLNFSLDFNEASYGTGGYIFPIFGDKVSSSYFFDSNVVNVASASGSPAYNLPFSLSENYSAYATAMNSVFRNISYTREYSPFPSTLGPSSVIYSLVDVYNGTGLYTFDYYTLNTVGNSYTVLYPALPLFVGSTMNITVNVPSIYFQVGSLNLTYSVRSTITLNYSGIYGDVDGNLLVTLGGVSVYSSHLSTVAGHNGVIAFYVTPHMSPGEYLLNVSMSENSQFSYNPISIPVVVYQDMVLNLSISPTYTTIGVAPHFTTIDNVSVSIAASGDFNSSYGRLFFTVYNGSYYQNYSNYLSIRPGAAVSYFYQIPSSMLLSHQINYTLSVYPGLPYEKKTVYVHRVNESLLATLSGVKYVVKSTGVGSAVLELNLSVSSLTTDSNYSVYLNGHVKASGYTGPGETNVSIPIVSGKNYVVVELNGQAYGTGGVNSSWNKTFYFYPVTVTGSIPPYMTAGYPPLLTVNISVSNTSAAQLLTVYLNGTEIPYNGSGITVRGVSSVNDVTVYEDVLGYEVMMSNTTFSSIVVYPPPLTPSGVTSLVGFYHTQVSFNLLSNVSLTNVTMVGVGGAYNHTIKNGVETFSFYTHFISAGVVNELLTVNGTIHGLPFSLNITVPVKVGYPAFSITYIGKSIVEYGTRSVELREINLNHTGTYDTLTVTVSSGAFSQTYTLLPNGNGIVSVPVPSKLGINTYSFVVTYNTGFTHSSLTFRNVVTVSILALPSWVFGIVAAVIAAIAGFFVYGRVFKNRVITKVQRTVKCGECKRDVPFDADKCPYCGAKFSDRMYCEECGSDIPRTSDYCPVCGNVFNRNLKLAEMLKGKYRAYVGEKRKELEKVVGGIQDAEFWRMVAQGNKTLGVDTFEVFRTKYMISGSFSETGVTVCPVCGSGVVLTEDKCPNCGVSTEMIMDYFARVNDIASADSSRQKTEKVKKPKKEKKYKERKKRKKEEKAE